MIEMLLEYRNALNIRKTRNVLNILKSLNSLKPLLSAVSVGSIDIKSMIAQRVKGYRINDDGSHHYNVINGTYKVIVLR